MPYEYLASVQSAVRRINDRIRSIANKLGKDSTLLQSYESLIDVNLGENTRFKDGLIQLHTPSDIYNDPEKMERLKRLEDSIQTWSQIKSKYEESYEKYLSSDEVQFLGESVDLDTYINVNNDLPQALVWLYPTTNDDLAKGVEIMRTSGRRKTYEELDEVISLARSGNKERQKDMTNYARGRRYGNKRRMPRLEL